MTNHNGVLMMQRLLLAGTLGLAVAQKAAAILDAANECLGHFDDRPPGERWCDALLHLLDLAAFAADLDSTA